MEAVVGGEWRCAMKANRRQFVKSVTAACIVAPHAPGVAGAATVPVLKNFTPEITAALEQLTPAQRIIVAQLVHVWGTPDGGVVPLQIYLPEDREIIERHD